ncbi:hypothetical protein QTI66_00750 [Variovorax sp. J22R133]|uniref:hypothetical protein n=1 Tax=Variovorax brevis TaxID=3053503 RepID=UPI00257872CB|nr:hypothetical protein [Variovorax sp. J22R133]MDM0110653.1 hypothetical protein [Variovorax sp. J22R133]
MRRAARYAEEVKLLGCLVESGCLGAMLPRARAQHFSGSTQNGRMSLRFLQGIGMAIGRVLRRQRPARQGRPAGVPPVFKGEGGLAGELDGLTNRALFDAADQDVQRAPGKVEALTRP